MFNCSLYFATVRRAITLPFSFRILVNRSSVNGLEGFSLSILSFSIILTSLEDISSPSVVCIASEKKNFKGYIPVFVCTYLLLLTRDIVEISKPVLSAISLRIIGLSIDSSSVKKKSYCMFTIRSEERRVGKECRYGWSRYQ